MTGQNHTIQDGAYRSKYTFTETPDGFVVRAEDRVPVRVQLCPTHFSVFADDGGESSNQIRYGYVTGLYQSKALLDQVSWILMRDWESPADKGKLFSGAKEQAHEHTAAAIRTRLYRQRRRLLARVDPIVLEVQRSMFAATRTVGSIALGQELYQHRCVVEDIINYRAAAIAAVHVYSLAHSQISIRSERGWGNARLDRQLERLLRAEDDPRIETNPFCEPRPSEVTLEVLTPIYIELMKNWRDLFSDTGKSYRSLDRTLMNLPSGITYKGLRNLVRLHLERPHTERLEFLVLLMYGQSRSKHNMHIFQHVRVPDIKSAIGQVAEATQMGLSPEQPLHVKFMVDYLAGYPEKHTGDITGLARRSIEWHRELDDEWMQDQTGAIGS